MAGSRHAKSHRDAERGAQSGGTELPEGNPARRSRAPAQMLAGGAYVGRLLAPRLGSFMLLRLPARVERAPDAASKADHRAQ